MSTSLLLPLLALAQAPPRTIPARGDSTSPVEISECRRLYDLEQFLAAARACEASGDLYWAGVARRSAGHDALAVARWEALLDKGGIAPAVRDEVGERLAEARPETVVVRVETSAVPETRTLVALREGQPSDALERAWPAGQASVEIPLDAGPWTLTLRGGPYTEALQEVRVEGQASRPIRLETRLLTAPVRVSLGPEKARRRGISLQWSGPRSGPAPETTGAPEQQWEMSYGTWKLAAAAQGFVPQEQEVKVEGPQGAGLKVELSPDRRSRVPTVVAGSLGGVAAVLLGAGIGATAWGAKAVGEESRSGNLYHCDEGAEAESDVVLEQKCDRAGVAVSKLSAGMGLLGAAIGSVVPMALAARRLPVEKVRVEAGIGAALTGLGVAWVITESVLCEGGANYTRGGVARTQVAAGLLGAGTMVLSGALIHFFAERRAAPRRTRQMARAGKI